MASFKEAPDGDSGKGAKIFKTKCAQCHVAEPGGGHKQVLLGLSVSNLFCFEPWLSLRSLAAGDVGAQSGRSVRKTKWHHGGFLVFQS